MQSLDYKLKTSNTNYVTARHDAQYFSSSLSSFSPATSRVCRIPLTGGTSFLDPETILIAFRVRNTDATNLLAPATPNPACFIQRIQIFFLKKRMTTIYVDSRKRVAGSDSDFEVAPAERRPARRLQNPPGRQFPVHGPRPLPPELGAAAQGRLHGRPAG